jgi:hypothetical protein
MSAKVTVIVYILICFEVGVLLAILPWTSYWDDNFFLYFLSGKLNAPGLASFLQSGYARGAVTGLGILNILAGVRDIIKFRESVEALATLEASPTELTTPVPLDSTATSSITLSDNRPPSPPPGN